MGLTDSDSPGDQRMSELTDKITELVGVVRIPDAVIAGLVSSQRRQRWYSMALAFSLAIDLALSVTIALGLIALNHIQDTQTSTSCNLYGLIIPSLSKPDPSQIDTSEKRKQYAAFARVILTDYGRLGCKG